MNTTKTELLEEMQQKITTFVEGYNEDQNFNYQVDNLMNEIDKALDRYRDSVVEEEREKINKYGRKYNKYPSRMLRSKHRYHKRINKKFNNCNLCREEI